MDCSPPGSSVHEISQSRILEWVAVSSSRGSSRPRDRTHISCIGRQILYPWTTWETHWGKSSSHICRVTNLRVQTDSSTYTHTHTHTHTHTEQYLAVRIMDKAFKEKKNTWGFSSFSPIFSIRTLRKGPRLVYCMSTSSHLQSIQGIHSAWGRLGYECGMIRTLWNCGSQHRGKSVLILFHHT